MNEDEPVYDEFGVWIYDRDGSPDNGKWLKGDETFCEYCKSYSRGPWRGGMLEAAELANSRNRTYKFLCYEVRPWKDK